MCLCMYVWLVLCKLTKGPSLFSDALHDIACYWQISLACHVHNIQSPTAHLFNTHTGKSWSNLGNVQITQMAISKQNGRLSVSSLACLLETFLGVYWWQTCQTTYFRDWIFQNVVSFFCLFVSIGQDAYDNLILRDTKKKKWPKWLPVFQQTFAAVLHPSNLAEMWIAVCEDKPQRRSVKTVGRSGIARKTRQRGRKWKCWNSQQTTSEASEEMKQYACVCVCTLYSLCQRSALKTGYCGQSWQWGQTGH